MNFNDQAGLFMSSTGGGGDNGGDEGGDDNAFDPSLRPFPFHFSPSPVPPFNDRPGRKKLNPCVRDSAKLSDTLAAFDAGIFQLGDLMDGTISNIMDNPSNVQVIGGHINLTLNIQKLEKVLNSTDLTNFENAFSGAIFGQRRDAGAVTMHSDWSKARGVFDFHFDLFNPKQDVFGLIGHLFGDVIGGHIGSPCLDPAWRVP